MIFWILGVTIKNVYVVYGSTNKEEVIYKSKRLSQYEFKKAIALRWINTDAMKKEKNKTTINKRK